MFSKQEALDRMPWSVSLPLVTLWIDKGVLALRINWPEA